MMIKTACRTPARPSRFAPKATLCLALAMASTAALAGPSTARPGEHAAARTGSTLEIKVVQVRNARGRVHVDICTAAQFLKSCPYSADAPAVPGVTTVRVNNVPPGAYAAQVFHDENANGEVERNFIGVPKEGVGFSRIGHVLLRAPRFAEAAFIFDGTATSVPVQIHYYLR